MTIFNSLKVNKLKIIAMFLLVLMTSAILIGCASNKADKSFSLLMDVPDKIALDSEVDFLVSFKDKNGNLADLPDGIELKWENEQEIIFNIEHNDEAPKDVYTMVVSGVDVGEKFEMNVSSSYQGSNYNGKFSFQVTDKTPLASNFVKNFKNLMYVDADDIDPNNEDDYNTLKNISMALLNSYEADLTQEDNQFNDKYNRLLNHIGDLVLKVFSTDFRDFMVGNEGVTDPADLGKIENLGEILDGVIITVEIGFGQPDIEFDLGAFFQAYDNIQKAINEGTTPDEDDITTLGVGLQQINIALNMPSIDIIGPMVQEMLEPVVNYLLDLTSDFLDKVESGEKQINAFEKYYLTANGQDGLKGTISPIVERRLPQFIKDTIQKVNDLYDSVKDGKSSQTI